MIRCLRAASLAFFLALSSTALSIAADPADEAAYKAAFAAMQADPGNSDKALAYAEAAIKVGNLEGAIGALERLLIFNPDLPQIRVELGVLYYRLGSYDLSRSYLAQLADREDVPDDVRAKVKEYLAQIDQLSSPHRVTGGLVTGFRYQTDANYGPGGSSLRILGLDFPIATNVAKKGDTNFFGLGTVNYVYDFQQADPLTIEANLTTYGQKQFRQTQLDLSLTQFDVGPRIGLPMLLEGSSVRPYIIGDYLSLGGSSFMSSYGGGINGVAPMMDRLAILANFEIQNRQYDTDPARPRIEDLTGDYIAVRLEPRYAVADNQLIGFTNEFDRTLAVQGYQRSTQVILGPNYQIRFASPLEQTGLVRAWTGSVGFDHIWRYYGTPDVLIDPANTRRDSQYDLGGTLEIPVVDGMSTLLQLQQTWANSNIPNYKYTNLLGMVAVSLKF